MSPSPGCSAASSSASWRTTPSSRHSISPGPDAAGLGRARDQQIVFFREHPGLSEHEYLGHAFAETAKLPGMADIFDRRHNPLWTVGPTGDAARVIIEFWRRTDAESGRPVHDFGTHASSALGEQAGSLSALTAGTADFPNPPAPRPALRPTPAPSPPPRPAPIAKSTVATIFTPPRMAGPMRRG